VLRKSFQNLKVLLWFAKTRFPKKKEKEKKKTTNKLNNRKNKKLLALSLNSRIFKH